MYVLENFYGVPKDKDTVLEDLNIGHRSTLFVEDAHKYHQCSYTVLSNFVNCSYFTVIWDFCFRFENQLRYESDRRLRNVSDAKILCNLKKLCNQ